MHAPCKRPDLYRHHTPGRPRLLQLVLKESLLVSASPFDTQRQADQARHAHSADATHIHIRHAPPAARATDTPASARNDMLLSGSGASRRRQQGYDYEPAKQAGHAHAANRSTITVTHGRHGNQELTAVGFAVASQGKPCAKRRVTLAGMARPRTAFTIRDVPVCRSPSPPASPACDESDGDALEPDDLCSTENLVRTAPRVIRPGRAPLHRSGLTLYGARSKG